MIDNSHHHLEPSHTLDVGSSKVGVTALVSKSMKEADVSALKSIMKRLTTAQSLMQVAQRCSGKYGRNETLFS